MCDRVTQHERMRRYLKHRERVFEAKSVVQTGMSRSASAKTRPSRPGSSVSRQKSEEQLRIARENDRLLKSLIRINEQPSSYSKALSRPASSVPRRAASRQSVGQ